MAVGLNVNGEERRVDHTNKAWPGARKERGKLDKLINSDEPESSAANSNFPTEGSPPYRYLQ